MQPDLHIDISDNTPEADMDVILEGVREYNRNNCGPDKNRPLNIIIRDDQNNIIAGLLADTWGQVCYIHTVWTAQHRRHTGLGTRLMQNAEQHAKQRGCTIAYVDTYSFQAPDFYTKFGFKPIATLDGFPRNIVQRFYRKTISD